MQEDSGHVHTRAGEPENTNFFLKAMMSLVFFNLVDVSCDVCFQADLLCGKHVRQKKNHNTTQEVTACSSDLNHFTVLIHCFK